MRRLATGAPPPATDARFRATGTGRRWPRYPRLGELVEVTAIIAYTSLDDEWE